MLEKLTKKTGRENQEGHSYLLEKRRPHIVGKKHKPKSYEDCKYMSLEVIKFVNTFFCKGRYDDRG